MITPAVLRSVCQPHAASIVAYASVSRHLAVRAFASARPWFNNNSKMTSSSSSSKPTILALPETDPVSSLALCYDTNGQPEDVLKAVSIPLRPVGPKEVLVSIVAAPMNPSDINQVQGVYPSRPDTREEAGYIGGNEGSGVILRVGSEVKNLKRGDLIIPTFKCPGTWRQYAVWPAEGVLKYGQNFSSVEEADAAAKSSPDGAQFDPKEAARLVVNPCTAYRMLRDFVELKPGNVVIQNGANSAVGQSVIQLAKIYKLHTINVIRERDTPEATEALKKSLTDIGADLVVTEKELVDGHGKLAVQNFNGSKASLALNCVGGSTSVNMADELEEGSPFVTYGAMSATPLPVSAKYLIFRNIKFMGFWMTKWYRVSPLSERVDMINHLRKYKNQNTFKFPDPEVEIQFGKKIEDVQNTLKELTGDKKGKRFLIF